MSRLNEIKARLAAATPGPWTLPPSTRSGRQMVFVTDEFGSYNICDSAGEMDAPIAEFVAHAPVDIAWLLAELAKYHECEYERPVCEYNIKDELGYVEPAIHVLNAGGYPPRKVWHKEGE